MTKVKKAPARKFERPVRTKEGGIHISSREGIKVKASEIPRITVAERDLLVNNGKLKFKTGNFSDYVADCLERFRPENPEPMTDPYIPPSESRIARIAQDTAENAAKDIVSYVNESIKRLKVSAKGVDSEGVETVEDKKKHDAHINKLFKQAIKRYKDEKAENAVKDLGQLYQRKISTKVKKEIKMVKSLKTKAEKAIPGSGSVKTLVKQLQQHISKDKANAVQKKNAKKEKGTVLSGGAKKVSKGKKAILEKSPKVKKGKGKVSRDAGRIEPLTDYFFDILSGDINANNACDIEPIFWHPSVSAHMPKFSEAIAWQITRQSKFTITNTLNEGSFQPYVNTKSVRLPLTEVLLFPEHDGAEVWEHPLVTRAGAKVITLHSKDMIDDYILKIAKMDY